MRTRHLFDLSEPGRLWGKVARRTTVEPDGCWRWGGHHTHDGYAIIQAKAIGKGWVPARVHRLLYVLAHGGDPEQLHHTCHHEWCINPEHVVETEPKEHKAEHHRYEVCRRGHAMEGHNVMVTTDGKRRCRTCANERGKRYSRAKSTFARGDHKTHCKHGHPWIPENIYTRKTGYRECIPCIRARTKLLSGRASK